MATNVKYPTGSIRLAKTGLFVVGSYFLYAGVAWVFSDQAKRFKSEDKDFGGDTKFVFDARDKIPGPSVKGDAQQAHDSSYYGVRHEKCGGEMSGSLFGVSGPGQTGRLCEYPEPEQIIDNRGRWPFA